MAENFECIREGGAKTLKRIITYVILIVFLATIPLFLKSPRLVHILIMVYLYTMLAGGLRLVMSTGQVSFAHAAFWAIGAYGSALLVMRLGLTFWIALPISGAIAGFVGFLIGYPCLRLKGPYFFIVTLAFGEITRMLLTSWVDLFGGANGIAGIPFPDPISIPLIGVLEFGSRSIHYYYLLLFLLLCSLFIMYRIENSRFGMTSGAIRESDDLCMSLGISPMRNKIIQFVVACIIAGFAGSFYAHYLTYISPELFTFWDSTTFLLMAVVGGTGSVSGVIVGVVILTGLPELARETARLEPIIYGSTLLLVLRFLPGGLWSLVQRLLRNLGLSRMT